MDKHREDLYLEIIYLRIIREPQEAPCSFYGNSQIHKIDLTTFLHTEYVPLDRTFEMEDFGLNDLVDLTNPKLKPFQKEKETIKIQSTKTSQQYDISIIYRMYQVKLVKDLHVRYELRKRNWLNDPSMIDSFDFEKLLRNKVIPSET